MIVIGLSVWIAVSNRPKKKSENPRQTEGYSVLNDSLSLSSEALPVENQRLRRDDIGYQDILNEAVSPQNPVPPAIPPVYKEYPTQNVSVESSVQQSMSPKREQPSLDTSNYDEGLASRGYDPEEQSSSLIDSDAVIEDEFAEGIFGIYLESEKGRVASAPIDGVINESTDISITVPEANSDSVVILCRGYKNYTYNWYRYGGGKRQGCGVVEDEQILIPCEFRPEQSFCNIRVCLLGHESEVNLDIKLEE